jgi:hypothetical protein
VKVALEVHAAARWVTAPAAAVQMEVAQMEVAQTAAAQAAQAALAALAIGRCCY